MNPHPTRDRQPLQSLRILDLPPAASGETLGAFALTEPHAGSNPADMCTFASREGDGYRIKGSKCFISNAGEADLWRIADRALQIHGGYGYSKDFPLERYLRDLRIFRIYEGSSEIQRTIIARDLLK